MNLLWQKKSLLLATLLTSTQLSAIELYNDKQNTVALRGYVSGVYVNSEDVDEINEGLSRWGFDLTRKLTHGWTAGLTLEWGLKFDRNSNYSYDGSSLPPQGAGEDSMFSRLGYVHFTHDKWGTIGIGKQWAVFYDVTGGSDILNLWGGSASGTFNLGTDGGLSGVGRAEQALTWRKSFNNLDVGLQFQAQDEALTYENPACSDVNLDPNCEFNGEQIATIGNGYGMSLVYNINKFKLGVAYNISEIDVVDSFNASSDDDEITAFSVNYGTNGKGLYVSAMYGMSENHELDDNDEFIDAEHSELVVKYTTDTGLGVYGGFNHLEPDDDEYTGEYEFHYNFVGVEYTVLDKAAKLFFEARKDDTTTSEGGDIDDSQFAVGATFYL